MTVIFSDVCTKGGIRNLNLSLDLSRITLLFDPPENLSRAILKVLVGLDELWQGEIQVDGIPHRQFLDQEPQLRNFGYIFDEGIMLSNLSLKENLMLPLRWLNPNLEQEETDKRIQSWMEKFALKLDLSQRPVAYRAGELKLLSYVRTLMLAPRVLFIVDPFYILNKRERDILYGVLRGLSKISYPMLIASIDDDFGAGFADEIIDLNEMQDYFALAASLS